MSGKKTSYSIALLIFTNFIFTLKEKKLGILSIKFWFTNLDLAGSLDRQFQIFNGLILIFNRFNFSWFCY